MPLKSALRDLWILVADSECALIFKNHGTARSPNLKLQEKWENENPPTNEQGTDKPGRFDDAGHGRSAVENTDWHEQAKTEFAVFLADKLNDAALNADFKRILLIADAATLGKMRSRLHDEVNRRLIDQKAADLTNHPVGAIEKQVGDMLFGKQLQ